MAKGQVSEKELSEALSSAGGLGGIVGASGARRDSPFGMGSPRAPEAVDPAIKSVRVAVPPAHQTPASGGELRGQAPPPSSVRDTNAKKTALKTPSREKAGPSPEAPTGAVSNKLSICSDSVTLPVPPELRDRVNTLATRLQRMRTEKIERMTANVVMRVAIEAFIEKFDPDKAPVSNTEAELLETVRSRLRWE